MKSLAAGCAALVLIVGCSGQTASVSTEQAKTTDVSTDSAQDVVEINLEVGKTTGETVSQVVAVGSNVRISILNQSEEEEYHLHGYDVSSGEVPAGETATIEFFADMTGSFELESHHSGDLLMTLIVE
jgi:hypothetical protein